MINAHVNAKIIGIVGNLQITGIAETANGRIVNNMAEF